MSYILDALRRAESERDRGAVPNIHAQPLAMTAAGGAPGRGSLAPWVVAGLALLVVAVLAWQLLDRKDAAPAAAPAVAMNSSAPPAPAPAVTQPQAVAVQPAPAVSVKAPPPVRAPARTAAPSPVRSPAPIERAVAQGDAPTAQTPPATRAPAGATQGLVYNRTDLPADVQRQLPNLAIGGSAYSQDSASRMLIINDQVFHEGDPLGPDLTLEQIQLKAAVFRFKGYRYRITF